ncbi:unnamed protein product, partial [Ceratitis capitata]
LLVCMCALLLSFARSPSAEEYYLPPSNSTHLLPTHFYDSLCSIFGCMRISTSSAICRGIQQPTIEPNRPAH